MSWRPATLSLLVTVCLAAASHAEEAIEGSAENAIEDWVATFNDNDPEKLLAFYDRSEDTEVVVSSGLRLRGYEAIQKAYNDDFKQVQFYDSSARAVSERLLGDTAIVTFEHVFKFQVTADESRWQIHVRTTSVLHRFEDEWRVVHEHSSPIRGIERMTPIED